MATRSQSLLDTLSATFGNGVSPTIALDEVSVDVPAAELAQVCQKLHDEPALRFTQLVDLCGVDYSAYGVDEWSTETAGGNSFSRGVNEASVGRLSFGDAAVLTDRDSPRFAVVLHLLSIEHNVRLRVRCYAPDDSFPVVASVTGIWACADWYEREAFDLYGILFEGHDDLRRLLTDYGFVGHPFRKDFPLVGNVEMRFDPAKGRVVYEPVTIEPRVLVPRVIRRDSRYVDPSVAADAANAAADTKES
ncbi:MAG: NADH-quinone oxidoreductase subunit C [Gammaproteobacteria bacterium]|nr:NADH-quinone oxidoreductase subunit C [Gammaproteobacteria bacterium]